MSLKEGWLGVRNEWGSGSCGIDCSRSHTMGADIKLLARWDSNSAFAPDARGDVLPHT